jgi:CarboxypepD_reg-like domain
MFVRIHFFIATVMLLLSAHFSFAQTATVTGMVRDTAGMPVEGALIAFQGSTKAVYTDGAGKFSIEVPADKNVILTINRLGYNESRRTVNVNSGESLNIAINLSTNNTLGTQVVVSNRIFDPGIPIPPRVFDHLPSPSGDITAILRFAGATSNNELSTQYMVRGGNFDENLVYINGIEIYRPILTRAGQQEGLSFPNPDMTENIMFSAGGFEAKYGDKMSSVLDVRYKRPTRFRSTLSMSLLGINVSAEGISEDTRFTWMIGIRQKSNRYLLRSLDTKGDYVASYTDAQGLFTYDITDNWTLQYLGGMSMNKYNLTPATRETDFGTLNNALRFTVYFEGQVLNKFQTQFHSLSLNYAGAGNWTHRWTASVFNSYETETFDVLGQYYIDQLEADFGKPTFGQVAFNRGVGSFLNHARNYLDAWITNGEYQGSWYGDKNTFTYGFKFQHERIVDELSEWNYVDSSGYSVPFYPLESFDLQDVVKSRAQLYSNRITGFIQYRYSDTLADSSQLVFTFGVRAHYWDMNGQTIFSPRMQLKWMPHWKRNVIFTAAGGLYSQPPFYRELRNYEGTLNRNVKAQTAVHAVVGTDITFKAWKRDFRFIGELFYKYLDNLNPYEVNDVRIRYFGGNMAYGYAYGLDLRLYGEFVKDAESWISVSLLRTQENLYNDYYRIYLNSDGDTIIPGYTLNNTPVDSITNYPGMIPRPSDQLLTFGLYFQDYLPMLPDCKMNLGLILGTGMPFGPPNHQRYQQVFRMPPYRRVDIGFSYQIIKPRPQVDESGKKKIFKSLWAGLEVFNLLQVNNTISYYWIKDVTGRSYAVPNYLTNRQLSVRVIAQF